MTKKFIILCGRYRFFSSLSFYHGLDMFLATRDALVINGSYPGFFTSSVNYYCWFRIPPEKKTVDVKNIPWISHEKTGVKKKKHPTGGQPPWDFSTNPTSRPAFMLITRPRTWWKMPEFFWGGKEPTNPQLMKGGYPCISHGFTCTCKIEYIDVSCICEFCVCFFEEDYRKVVRDPPKKDHASDLAGSKKDSL